MTSIAENLERYFKTSMDQPQPMQFFACLADYVRYILETPTLKKIADKVLQMKNDEYDELHKLEVKSLEELGEAKKHLLKAVSDANIPRDVFKTRWAFTPGVSESLLDDFDLYEQGR